jgi:hypothetical protein
MCEYSSGERPKMIRESIATFSKTRNTQVWIFASRMSTGEKVLPARGAHTSCHLSCITAIPELFIILIIMIMKLFATAALFLLSVSVVSADPTVRS